MPAKKWRPKTEAEQIAAREAQAEKRRQYASYKREHHPYYRVIYSIRKACRQNPALIGQPAKIEMFSKGTRYEIKDKARKAQFNLRRWLISNYPIENWEIRTLKVEGEWGDYEMWAVYHGQFETIEQAAKYRAAQKLLAQDRPTRAKTLRSGAVAFRAKVRDSEAAKE